MKNPYLLYMALTFALLLPPSTLADPTPYVYPPVNAYSVGMGSAGVALAHDPSIIFWNPGGIGLLDRLAVEFSMASSGLESPGSWAFIMANSSDNDDNRFGLGIIRQHSELDESTYKSYTVLLPLATSLKTNSLPIGMTVKMLSEKLNDEDWHFGAGIDFGVMWQTKTGMLLGLSRLNIFGSSLRSYERQTWFGFGWEKKDFPVKMGAQCRLDRPLDLDYINQHYRTGVEIDLTDDKQTAKKEYQYSVQTGFIREGDTNYLSGGISALKIADSVHFSYSMGVDTRTWSHRIYMLTYGYSSLIKKQPRSGLVKWSDYR